jgi:protein-glutamine gamma-glutamyltransferase
MIIRQSDAHAWAEVWLQGQGWVRIDPTAAVSPERIEQGISEALRDSDELPLLARGDFPLLKKAFLNFDSINNGWNQWVLGYDDKKQMEFLNNLTGKKLGLSDLVFGMIGAMILVMLATSYFLFRKAKAKLNPAQQLYREYLSKLKRANLQPNMGEGALDFAARASQQLPNQQDNIKQIAMLYNALQYNSLKYSDGTAPDLLKQLQHLIQQLNIKK